MKLNVNETNLTIEAESLPESMYFKHVLGLSTGDSTLLELRDPGILITTPRPNQLVKICVEIDGYREKAMYQATGTLRNGDKIFGSGDSVNESLGAMMCCRNDWAELFGVDVKFPCNADYHSHGLKDWK